MFSLDVGEFFYLFIWTLRFLNFFFTFLRTLLFLRNFDLWSYQNVLLFLLFLNNLMKRLILLHLLLILHETILNFGVGSLHLRNYILLQGLEFLLNAIFDVDEDVLGRFAREKVLVDGGVSLN